MRYYTLEETGAWLKLTEDQVFERTTGVSGPILWPAVAFDSVEVCRYLRKEDQLSVTGMKEAWQDFGSKTDAHDSDAQAKQEPLDCFEKTLSGVYDMGSDVLVWDADGLSVVNAIVTDELDEHGRQISLIVRGGQSIRRDALRISAASIEHYMELKNITVPDRIRREAENKSSGPPDLTPEFKEAADAYIMRIQGEIKGMKEDDRKAIVYLGLINHFHMAGAKAVELLYPGKYKLDERGNKKTQGSRIKTRGVELLARYKKES